MRSKIFFFILAKLMVVSLSVSAQQDRTLRKADSLFANQRFSDARALYASAFFNQKKSTPANLLKLAFIEEGMENPVMSIFYLQQYYLFRPDAQVKSKIEEMATQNKLAGFSVDEADYAYFLYRVYGPYLELGLLGLGMAVFLFLLYRRLNKVSLGYTPVFTFIFLISAAYLLNFHIPYKRAVLSGERIFLMSGPSAGSSVMDVLTKGHRVEWIGENDIWYEIKWNEKKGWVKRNELLFFM